MIQENTVPTMANRWVLPALVFLATVSFLAGISRGAAPSYDGKIMLSVTQSLVENGSLRVPSHAFDFNTFNSTYASFGIGMSLLYVPLYLLQQVVGPGRFDLVVLTNAIVTALTTAVLYAIGRELGWGRRASLLIPLVFVTLTMAPLYAAELFAEPTIGLGMTIALLGMLRWRKGTRYAPMMIGGALALNALFRTDSLLLCGVMLLALPLFVPLRTLWQTKREIAIASVPLAGVVVWIALYNWIRWDSPFARGYEGQGFTTDFLFGLWSLVVSPGKGFVWYNPILFLAPLGLILMWKRDRAVAVSLILPVLIRPAFYAPWSDWAGGVAWGPRFLLPLCPLLAIPVALFMRTAAGWRPGRRATAALVIGVFVAAALFVNLVGLWSPYEWALVEMGTPPKGLSGDAAEAATARQAAEYYFTFSGNHIATNARYLTEGPPKAMALFWRKVSALGIGLLLGAGLLALAGIFLSKSRPRSKPSELAALPARPTGALVK